jgi:hypothetical protein
LTAILLAGLAGAALAQTAPPTTDQLIQDNQQATQTQADKTRAQNLQMQMNLNADKAQRDYNFAPNPNLAGANPAYVPPRPPPPRP